jgi:hypothetical protein
VPAHQEWAFTREDAARVSQPVLAVRGADGLPFFREVDELLQEWLPQTETFVLPNATHALQMQKRARWPKAWPVSSPATRYLSAPEGHPLAHTLWGHCPRGLGLRDLA